MSTQIGFTKADLAGVPGYGTAGQVVRFIASEIVPRSSQDASGIRRLYVVDQQGGVDDNQVTIYTFTVGVGWTFEEPVVDGSVTEMKTYVTEELPNIANYTQLTVDELTELVSTINSYVAP